MKSDKTLNTLVAMLEEELTSLSQKTHLDNEEYKTCILLVNDKLEFLAPLIKDESRLAKRLLKIESELERLYNELHNSEMRLTLLSLLSEPFNEENPLFKQLQDKVVESMEHNYLTGPTESSQGVFLNDVIGEDVLCVIAKYMQAGANQFTLEEQKQDMRTLLLPNNKAAYDFINSLEYRLLNNLANTFE